MAPIDERYSSQRLFLFSPLLDKVKFSYPLYSRRDLQIHLSVNHSFHPEKSPFINVKEIFIFEYLSLLAAISKSILAQIIRFIRKKISFCQRKKIFVFKYLPLRDFSRFFHEIIFPRKDHGLNSVGKEIFQRAISGYSCSYLSINIKQQQWRLTSNFSLLSSKIQLLSIKGDIVDSSRSKRSLTISQKTKKL